jgi:hypothetical protein
MSSEAAQQYQEYAAQCLRIAQQTADEAQKMRLLEMAQAWRRLAEAAAQREQK